jgi:hypothetical protein
MQDEFVIASQRFGNFESSRPSTQLMGQIDKPI